MNQKLKEDARTVLSVAAHLEQLKAAARFLQQWVGARERGYFTPSEDEEVRHLFSLVLDEP